MLTRRQLLTRGTTVLLMVPIAGPLLGCSDGGDDDGGGCSGVSSASTVDESHNHTLCVSTADLTSPPAAGATYTTTRDSNHDHKVVLTQANLTAIAAGQTVSVTSSSDIDPINNAAHTHGFMIKQA